MLVISDGHTYMSNKRNQTHKVCLHEVRTCIDHEHLEISKGSRAVQVMETCGTFSGK